MGLKDLSVWDLPIWAVQPDKLINFMHFSSSKNSHIKHVKNGHIKHAIKGTILCNMANAPIEAIPHLPPPGE